MRLLAALACFAACSQPRAWPLVPHDAGAPEAAAVSDGRIGTPADLAAPPSPDAARSDAACVGPLSGCAPQSGSPCDPVCQTGCGCSERCGATTGGLACSAAAGATVDLNAACDPRADRCRPGAGCLAEARSECGAHCYRFCRVDADCPAASRCTIPTVVMRAPEIKACSPPGEACNPVGTAACASPDRSLPTFGCYILSAKYPDTAVCDCAGTKAEGDACAFEHECRPGLECVKVGTSAICRRLCRLGVPGDCPVGQLCTVLSGGTRYGYCRL